MLLNQNFKFLKICYWIFLLPLHHHDAERISIPKRILEKQFPFSQETIPSFRFTPLRMEHFHTPWLAHVHTESEKELWPNIVPSVYTWGASNEERSPDQNTASSAGAIKHVLEHKNIQAFQKTHFYNQLYGGYHPPACSHGLIQRWTHYLWLVAD